MYSAGDFRNGVTFELEGNVYSVVEFQHVKPGKGAAFVRTKLKNVITGSVIEKTFSPTEKFPQAFIENRRSSSLFQLSDKARTKSARPKKRSTIAFFPLSKPS